MAQETLSKRAQLVRAIHAYGEAQFACGEWDRNESDEDYSTVYERATRAEATLMQLVGLLPAGRVAGGPLNVAAYQPKTGSRCSCRPGIERDNCPSCEGTGWVIDFAEIRRATAAPCGEPLNDPDGYRAVCSVRRFTEHSHHDHTARGAVVAQLAHKACVKCGAAILEPFLANDEPERCARCADY